MSRERASVRLQRRKVRVGAYTPKRVSLFGQHRSLSVYTALAAWVEKQSGFLHLRSREQVRCGLGCVDFGALWPMASWASAGCACFEDDQSSLSDPDLSYSLGPLAESQGLLSSLIPSETCICGSQDVSLIDSRPEPRRASSLQPSSARLRKCPPRTTFFFSSVGKSLSILKCLIQAHSRVL